MMVLATLVTIGWVRSESALPSYDGGDIELVSAGGCTVRSGPATLNQNCIYVRGEGLHVESIKGYIQAGSFPYGPSTVCEITVEMTGTLAGNVPYFQSARTQPGCSFISRGITATVNKTFAPDSKICSRTYWGATYGWSTPACITVRY
ncbi:MAG: hypothetical protein L0I24_20890 [Pseudonocardia sp.]|nr:hypothetical protein [Pseudonocardia sp.]